MFRLTATSVLALGLGAAPVLAQVTPAQVWENVQRYGADRGYEVTASVEDAGNTLTVRDAVFATTNSDGSTRLTVPQMTLSQTGDARVRLVIDGDVAINSTFPAPAPQDTGTAEGAGTSTDAEPADLAVNGTISAPGNEILVSGTPEDMLYEYAYPTVSVSLDIPVGPEGDATLPFTASLTDLAGSQRNGTGEDVEATFDMAVAEAAMQIAGTVPPAPARDPARDPAGSATEGSGTAEATGGGSIDFRARLTDLTVKGSNAMPNQPLENGAQLTEALAAGMTVDAAVAYQALEGSFAMTGQNEEGADQTGNGTFATGLSDLRMQLSANGLNYAGNTADTRIEMTLSELPFPLSLAADRTSADMMIPVMGADSAQPFRLAYALEAVTFADGIWALFDPTGQLPRDPASLVVDVDGNVTLTDNLFDPAAGQPETDSAGAAVPPAPPFAPQDVTVNRVALDAAGASAEITGSLDFGDNPAQPVGRLNGTFEGVNGLLDTLVTMGLVPQEQIMGIRMALTMFARPAEDDPDRLTSEIEFREGGAVFANGQQVR
ncbi:hypothetical protein EYE42_08380 [Paracoccus subflavus]|uniref:DUF2125 domain-containing protein n=1 Tax=Paracoccus subflavus TaxID=2528244 RepID=A0A4V2JCA1_9RHOB|nr:DUF2125 domain-containing protein [Paracoccus subflavus]TBN40403.1 hypothetical protein EYE42_08380 [Paracoccus subflavus]